MAQQQESSTAGAAQPALFFVFSLYRTATRVNEAGFTGYCCSFPPVRSPAF